MHSNLYTWKKPIWNYLVCLLLVFHRYLQYIHWPIANNCIYFCLCDTLPLHIKLPAIAFEIWWFLVSSFKLSVEVLFKSVWVPFQCILNFLWSSHDAGKLLIKILVNFLWISFSFLWNSDEFDWISRGFLWIASEFLWISFEFLLNFIEFLMNFLWISYAVLTQFLCSSYVDFKTSYLFG